MKNLLVKFFVIWSPDGQAKTGGIVNHLLPSEISACNEKYPMGLKPISGNIGCLGKLFVFSLLSVYRQQLTSRSSRLAVGPGLG
jgi:hypothetical protein